MCYILLGETPKRLFQKSVTCQSRNPMVNPSKIFVRQVDVEFNLAARSWSNMRFGASKKHLMIDWLTMENSKPVKPVSLGLIVFSDAWLIFFKTWAMAFHGFRRRTWLTVMVAVCPLPSIAADCHNPLFPVYWPGIARRHSWGLIDWLIHLGAMGGYHWDGGLPFYRNVVQVKWKYEADGNFMIPGSQI